MAARHRSPEHPTPLTYQILLALADTPMHGYGIIKEIEEREGEGVAPSTGALYLAVQRMEAGGLIQEAPAPPDQESDPRRKYYRITDRGWVAAQKESVRLEAMVAVARGKRLLTRADA